MAGPTTVTANAMCAALRELGIDPIGVHSVHVNRIDGTVVVERLATDSHGRYLIDGTDYATHSQTLDVI
ncbi:hypothetical protein CH282_09415 [Rhodococcus sp. 06-418-1B]|nr:hypothetical protein [Rhodococcus sp. 06-418-1B]OZC88337.1 hypothetical protein CH282_09415 [Rhodococcus sp. 06-418-1B]